VRIIALFYIGLTLLGPAVTFAEEWEQDHAAFEKATSDLYQRYEADSLRIHSTPTMGVNPSLPKIKEEIRVLHQALDPRDMNVGSAKRLLNRLQPGERLLLKIATHLDEMWHWDVIEVKLNHRGEIEIADQFGLNPGIPSNHRGESRSQWLARENRELRSLPDKYYIQDWRVVPKGTAKSTTDFLTELREAEDKFFKARTYIPGYRDCRTAANFFWGRLPSWWSQPKERLKN
jgi:hypothetical protein